MPIRRALLSVSDKTNLLEFARRLAGFGVELISTGGTARALRAEGLMVRDVSEVTGFPEMLDGRVKTLHPVVHGGLLARRDMPEHLAAIAEHGIEPIDLVVVNLYPFAATVARPDCTREEAVENIDIGGPAMLRSAAKNHDSVTVVVDPQDYTRVVSEMERHGGDTTPALRRRLMAKVFAHTSAYDAAIATHFEWEEARAAAPADQAYVPPPVLRLAVPLRQSLRYGENPHQRAAFYADPACRETSLARARQLHGKELSYNNILDAEGALEACRDLARLGRPSAVIVKHGNPCGMAVGTGIADAFDRARQCDPDSAFGGIVALSAPCDAPTAAAIGDTFFEVILAPSFTPEALAALQAKKNLRLIETGEFTEREPALLVRGVVGGVLTMDRDLGEVDAGGLKVVSRRQPTPDEVAGMLFAWRCVKWIKSNAIVLCDQTSTIGIGAGQMSRVDSARLAVRKARRELRGSFLASDAFFPFRDTLDEIASCGIAAVIQPGGSVRDAEVIAAADEHGLAMVFTGMRHFRH